MFKSLATATLASTLMVTAAAAASPPPDCNSPEVIKVLQKHVNLRSDPRDLKSDADKRWCSVTALVNRGRIWASTARMWYDDIQQQEVVFTIEWINEAEGRFWLEGK